MGDANEESNILDNIEDDKVEDTSLIWDHNMGSLLLGHQSEDYQSTPKPKEQLYNNESENQKHYENTTYIQNSKNEKQEEITSAMEANKEQIEMLLRDREQLQEAVRFKDFV